MHQTNVHPCSLEELVGNSNHCTGGALSSVVRYVVHRNQDFLDQKIPHVSATCILCCYLSEKSWLHHAVPILSEFLSHLRWWRSCTACTMAHGNQQMVTQERALNKECGGCSATLFTKHGPGKAGEIRYIFSQFTLSLCKFISLLFGIILWPIWVTIHVSILRLQIPGEGYV